MGRMLAGGDGRPAETEKTMKLLWIMIASGAMLLAQNPQQAQQRAPMTFFITSAGPGNGANLGGLAGADAHCQKLAAAAGAGDRTWHAYLSTSAAGGKPPGHARDPIGKGPRAKREGAMIAEKPRKPQ